MNSLFHFIGHEEEEHCDQGQESSSQEIDHEEGRPQEEGDCEEDHYEEESHHQEICSKEAVTRGLV